MAFMRPGRGRRRLIANVELTSNNDPRMVRFGELPAKVQEQFTRQAIREILRPIARSEGLSTRIVVGLGSWFEEGSFAVQRAGRYAFPAETPEETVHRVLARASLALKQSGYFAARPEPGTERWAIEVDFGRSLSPEEYIRHVEAMSQDAPTFRGTTMVSLSPARVQIVLDEGLGRDAVQQTLEHIAARLPDDYVITWNAYEVRTVEGYGEDWFRQVLDRRGLSEEQSRVDREVHQRFERLADEVANATRRFLPGSRAGELDLPAIGALSLLPATGALAASRGESSPDVRAVVLATGVTPFSRT